MNSSLSDEELLSYQINGGRPQPREEDTENPPLILSEEQSQGSRYITERQKLFSSFCQAKDFRR